MKRAWIGAALFGAGVAAGGCTDPTPPKRELAQPVESGPKGSPGSSAGTTKPAETDPAAEAVLGRLVKAHTGGKPEALEATKVYKLVRKGRFEAEGSPGPAVWTTHGVWPNQFRMDVELSRLGNVTNIRAETDKTAWEVNPLKGVTVPTPMSPTDLDAFKTDARAEWWTVLAPLTDARNRVAALAEPAPVDGKPAAGVRVWVGGNQPVVLRVDEESNRLVRVEYRISMASGDIPIGIRYVEHKTVGGLLLPGKFTYSLNNSVISTWDTADYEFPKQIPAEKFEKP